MTTPTLNPMVPAVHELTRDNAIHDTHYYCSHLCRENHIKAGAGEVFKPYALGFADDYVSGGVCEYCNKRLRGKLA